MDEEEFARFFKRGGRSVSVIKRCLGHVAGFEQYLGMTGRIRSSKKPTKRI